MNHQANNFSFSLNYSYTVKQNGAEKKWNYKYGKFVLKLNSQSLD